MTFMTSRTLFLLLKYLIQLMLEWNCFSLMKASSHKLLFLMTPKIWCERWDDVTDEVTDSYRVTKEIEKSLELPVITNKEILCLILTPVSSLSSSLSPKNTVSHGSVTCFLFCLTSWVFRVNHILMKGKRRRKKKTSCLEMKGSLKEIVSVSISVSPTDNNSSNLYKVYRGFVFHSNDDSFWLPFSQRRVSLQEKREVTAWAVIFIKRADWNKKAVA